MLPYKITADAVDGYFALSKTTVREVMKRFCAAVVNQLGYTFLQNSTKLDNAHLLQDLEQSKH